MTELPKELKEKLDGMLLETKETREILDAIDKEMFTTDHFTPETLERMAAKATGGGNYLRKKLGKLIALARNEEANRFLAIKFEAAQQNAKVTESAAQMEASAYIGPIRMTREIMNSYVESAERILSFCRMQRAIQDGYHSSERTNQVEV